MQAGDAVIYGTDTTGSTWAPIAEVLNAKGIPFTWNGQRKIITC